MGQITDYLFLLFGLIALIVLFSINKKLKSFNKLLRNNKPDTDQKKHTDRHSEIDYSKFNKEREKYLQECRRYVRHHSIPR